MSTVIPKEHLNTLNVCCFEFLQVIAIITSPQTRIFHNINTIRSKQAALVNSCINSTGKYLLQMEKVK